MRKRLWDLAKSRIEIGTILPGHRHKVRWFGTKNEKRGGGVRISYIISARTAAPEHRAARPLEAARGAAGESSPAVVAHHTTRRRLFIVAF